MKTKILILSILVSAGVCTSVMSFSIPEKENQLFVSNVEALSTPEESWKGKKLKVVSCTCPDGKSGSTLACRTDGNLEDCSETQQGLKGCYKILNQTKICDITD